VAPSANKGGGTPAQHTPGSSSSSSDSRDTKVIRCSACAHIVVVLVLHAHWQCSSPASCPTRTPSHQPRSLGQPAIPSSYSTRYTPSSPPSPSLPSSLPPPHPQNKHTAATVSTHLQQSSHVVKVQLTGLQIPRHHPGGLRQPNIRWHHLMQPTALPQHPVSTWLTKAGS
jgi:hypothetical protein